ncbi:MAG: serine--tRNA ligase [Acidobacteriota bacterium]
MLDINFIRENVEAIQDKLRERGYDLTLDGFMQLDGERKRLLQESEKLKHLKNVTSEEIGKLIKQKKDVSALKVKMKQVSAEIHEYEEKLKNVELSLRLLQLEIPNIPHRTVPVGKSEEDNRVERVIGEKPTFDFEPKPHWEIGTDLNILDFDRASKITGARFAIYKEAGALLERALINFMLDLHVKEHGYTEVLPPFIVNADSLFGTAQLPKFESDLFRLKDYDYYLVPTAEVPVTNFYAGEILEKEMLPINYVAYTPCFRSEAGSYGKDVRGLIRQHQFNKVELVKFTEPDSSYDELENLTCNAEEVLKRLSIPYRVVTLCTTDLGFAASKTYDIEVWIPSQNIYREISSCSNFEDFQARRANIRYRPHPKAKPEFVHTLNGSGLAIGRTVVAILENFQQKDGSVVIPEALRPFMNGLSVISKLR